MKLTEFCQRESTSSGGILDLEEWLSEGDADEGAFEITTWQPTPKALERITRWCPDLTTIRLLIDDQHMESLRSLDCPIEEIEAHVTWSGISGTDLIAVAFAQTLAKLSLTMLEGYSYSVIESIGRNCFNLSSLHLNFWSTEVADEEVLDLSSRRTVFPRLHDLNVRRLQAVLQSLEPLNQPCVVTGQMRGTRGRPRTTTVRLFPLQSLYKRVAHRAVRRATRVDHRGETDSSCADKSR